MLIAMQVKVLRVKTCKLEVDKAGNFKSFRVHENVPLMSIHMAKHVFFRICAFERPMAFIMRGLI